MPRQLPLVWICALGTTLLAGCAQVGVPVPPSLELPKPVSELRAVRKGDHVNLSWTAPTKITEGGVIRRLGPTRICRSQTIPMTSCAVEAGRIAPTRTGPGAMAFADHLSADLIRPDMNAEAGYAVEVLNSDGRSAGLSNVATVPLLPTLPSTESLEAQVTPQGVLLTWHWPMGISPTGGLDYRLRVYRRAENQQSETKVGEVELKEDAKAELLDTNPDWEKTFYYRYTWVTVASETPNAEVEVEGDDSPEARVVVHDIFPPATPAGLQAVFSSVGQPNFIDLTWSPNTDADLAGYSIYRREEGEAGVKISSELAKIPTYRDRDVHPGKKYFYSVTAVDVRGNESVHSDEAAESVP